MKLHPREIQIIRRLKNYKIYAAILQNTLLERKVPLLFFSYGSGITTLRQKEYELIIRVAPTQNPSRTLRLRLWERAAWENLFRRVILLIALRSVSPTKRLIALVSLPYRKVILKRQRIPNPQIKILLVNFYEVTWPCTQRYMTKHVAPP